MVNWGITKRRPGANCVVIGVLLWGVLGASRGPPAAGQGREVTGTENHSETMGRASLATVRIRAQQSAGTGRSVQYGTGVILTYDGYIITANHVVTGFDRITVDITGDQVLEAHVVLRDANLDVALLKVSPNTPLKPAVIAARKELKPGGAITMIGNPYGMQQKAINGVLGAMRLTTLNGKWCALQRVRGWVAPGYSGGGAFDTETGELLGLVLAHSTIREQTGYVLPIRQVWRAVEQGPTSLELVDAQEIEDKLGVRARPVEGFDSHHPAMLLTAVCQGSRAAIAGWRGGDVLLRFDQYQMVNTDAILYVLRETWPRANGINYRLARDGERVEGGL